MLRRRFESWGQRSGLVLYALAGCATTTIPPDEPPTSSAATPAGPPQLVCYAADGKLVVADAAGQRLGELRAQPPANLVTLAVARGTLVGASPGQVWALLPSGTAPEPAWHQVARWNPTRWSAEPLRAATYGRAALVWMRGNDPGTIPAALEVTAQGQAVEESLQVVENRLGGPWQSSHAPTGPLDRSFPAALRLLVAQVRVTGQLAREELLHSEASPWGGRLVAPNLGLEPRGSWPEAPLFYLGAAPGSPPVPLQYKDEPLMFRSLIGYGATTQLYLDGSATRVGPRLLVVPPPGSPGQGKTNGRKPLEARVVPTMRLPCAVVPPDWHE